MDHGPGGALSQDGRPGQLTDSAWHDDAARTLQMWVGLTDDRGVMVAGRPRPARP